MTDVHVEWSKLCVEHDLARDAYLEAFAAVNTKFSAIAKDSSRVNRTEDELEAMESAWKRWEGVKRRMKDFMKQHA